MNTIITQVTNISKLENLNILECKTENDTITLLSLELPEQIKISTKLKIAMKPTNIIIAKNFTNICSCENILKAKIKDIDNGKLLSSITIEYCNKILESIITLNAAKKLSLKIDDNINLLIKASDIYIKEILDD